MKKIIKINSTSLAIALTISFFLLIGTAYAGQLMGAEKNVCNPCNPCGRKMMNPCNPCAQSGMKQLRKTKIADYSKLVKKGEKLWSDESLGNSGLSCMSCHGNHQSLNLDKVGAFPHYVKMSQDVFTLDQMINYCMINPIEAKRLDPYSIEMTAMAAYYQEYIKSYKGPKNVCNPCGKMRRNPCNPCGR